MAKKKPKKDAAPIESASEMEKTGVIQSLSKEFRFTKSIKSELTNNLGACIPLSAVLFLAKKKPKKDAAPIESASEMEKNWCDLSLSNDDHFLG